MEMHDDGKPVPAAARTHPAPATTSSSHYPAVIASALHAVMGKVGYVQKKGTNKFQDYKYAGEAHVLEALRPEMVDAGLMLIPSGKHRSAIDEYGITHVEVEYTLLHKDGSVWPDKIIAYGDGGDKNSKGVGDKGLYKALTGANKYLLFKLFQLETGDDPEKDSEHDKDDGSSTGQDFITKEQEKIIADLILEAKADTKRFLDFLGCRAIYEIPASQFNQAKQALEAKKAKVPA
jgi:hypothetical protein